MNEIIIDCYLGGIDEELNFGAFLDWSATSAGPDVTGDELWEMYNSAPFDPFLVMDQAGGDLELEFEETPANGLIVIEEKW